MYNNNFLNTALQMQIPEPKTILSYLHLNDPIIDNNLEMKVEKIELNCETLHIPKKNKNILVDTLIESLYDKYIKLALANEKTINNMSFKYNFLTKWLKGDATILVDKNNADIRISSRIMGCCNLIAVNSRIGSGNFIITNQKILNYLMELDSYTPEDLSKIREPRMIHSVGSINGIQIFVNFNCDIDRILVGRTSYNVTSGGNVVILEHKKEVLEDSIKWTGLISETANTTKYNFDMINIQFVDTLPWFKKLIYKFAKKRKWLNG